LSLFVDIPENDFKDMLEGIELDGIGISAIQRAQTIQFMRKLWGSLGLEPPTLGGSKRARPPSTEQPQNSQSSGTNGAAPPSALCLEADLVSINRVVDQSIKAQVKTLDYSELARYRAFYEKVTGCEPPEESLPTADQLAGLMSVLCAGRVPYVDFAVWSTLGPRMSKFRRTEASVFVGGELVTKSLDGPSNFNGWEESWSLFAVAMISLGAATPGSLQAYHAGIKQLLRLFPGKWGTIAAVDLVARSERWTRLREEFERSPPPNFSPKMPWDLVIKASSFNHDGAYGNWWHLNFVLPSTLHQPSPATEGLQKPPADKTRAPPVPKAPGHFVRGGKGSREICSNYNNRAGECAGEGKCPNGRSHTCNVCSKQHRACDHHVQNRFSSGKGKKGKGKGKGKKGENDQGQA